MSAFEQAVMQGVALLRELPRDRGQIDEARARFRAFRAAHLTVQAELVTDWTPASTRVDYDLLLRDEGHGTLALSHTKSAHSPWSIERAEHWAAQRVLTIDDQVLSVHDALRIWQHEAAHEPGLMQKLLDEALIARATPDDDAEVSDEELQRSADGLRRRLGLHDSARTRAWLTQHGLSLAGLEDLARRAVLRERWLQRMFDADGEAYFERHPRELERVQVCFAYADENVLEALKSKVGPGRSLLGAIEDSLQAGAAEAIEAKLTACFACELPSRLGDASLLETVGPFQMQGRWVLAQLLSRKACKYEGEVRRAVQTRLFTRWLERERAAADIRWHWL